MRRLLFIGILCFTVVASLAQDRVKLDSLQLLLRNEKEDSTQIQTLLDIALLYYNYNYANAARYAQQARDLAIRKGYKNWEAKANRALATTCLAMGDYKNSATHYFKALAYYEDVRDTMGTMAMNNNLGNVYDRLQDFDKALVYYFKARDLLSAVANPQKHQQLPTIYNNIANIYQTKKDIQSAQQYYEKGLALARESGNKATQGTLCNNLGKLYLNDLHQPDSAIVYLEEGLKLRKELDDKGEIARSSLIIADYYYQQGDYSRAKASALQTIQMGVNIGSLETEKSAYHLLSKVEEALGNYNESLMKYKEYKRLSDSLQNQHANEEVTRLQLQYDFEKAERVHELERSQTRLRYISTIVVLSVGMIIAILIAIIVRTRARQAELKQRNLAQDVEMKNKELTTNVMYLIRKNELINSVAERLLKLQTTLRPENHKVVQEIILELQKEADNDSWKEFELRFQRVHSEFYTTLRKLYPQLSPSEEKLCAFLRLNMSSKEIAAITQQSIKSIEVARARLRKKLDLTNTNSNLVTHLTNL